MPRAFTTRSTNFPGCGFCGGVFGVCANPAIAASSASTGKRKIGRLIDSSLPPRARPALHMIPAEQHTENIVVGREFHPGVLLRQSDDAALVSRVPFKIGQ